MSVDKLLAAYKLSRNEFIKKYREIYPDDKSSESDIGKLWDAASGDKDKKKTTFDKMDFGDTKKALASLSEIQDISTSLVSSRASTEITQPSELIKGTAEMLSGFFGKEGGLVKGLSNVADDLLSKLINDGGKILQQEVNLRNELNSKIGIAGDMSKAYRDTIFQSLSGVTSMGYGYEELKDTVIATMQETGKFTTFNSDILQDTAVTARAFVGTLEDMGKYYRNFELVGVGAEKTLESINKAGQTSLSLGLQGRNTVKILNDNLSKLNEYGFSKGVDGLARMVQKSTEFRINMSETFKIADKVFSPEGAIELSANLQVLGGAIGDFNDPLKLMYMATNDVEGLQDALIGAAGSLATYNSEQGKFEITGANLRRAKAMAAELGVEYGELAKGAIAAAERTSASAALMSQGLDIDGEQMEFITNIARMGKDGRMVIDVSSISKEFGGAQTKFLDELTQQEADILIKQQDKFKAMDTRDIALDQFTETQKLFLTVSEISTMIKVQFAQNQTLRGGTSKIDEYIAKGNEYLNSFAKSKPGTAEGEAINALRSMTVDKMVDKYSKDAGLDKINSMNIDNKEKVNKQESSSSTKTVIHKVEHTLNAVQPIMDEVGRGIVRNPSMMDDLLNRNPGEYLYQ
jgi:hypothetical protein